MWRPSPPHIKRNWHTHTHIHTHTHTHTYTHWKSNVENPVYYGCPQYNKLPLFEKGEWFGNITPVFINYNPTYNKTQTNL